MTRQRNDLDLFRKGFVRKIRDFAVLREQKLMPQIFARISAVKERRFENRIFCERGLNSSGKYPAAGLILKITVSPDMVGV